MCRSGSSVALYTSSLGCGAGFIFLRALWLSSSRARWSINEQHRVLIQNRSRRCRYMWSQVLIEDKLKSYHDMKKLVKFTGLCLLFAPPSLQFMQLYCGISCIENVAVIHKTINLPSEIRYCYLFHTRYYGYTARRRFMKENSSIPSTTCYR